MILAVLLVVAAVLSLVVILWIAISRGLRTSARAGRTSQIHALDVEGFRNLADPAEDEYLRGRLSASEFRAVRRARLRALAAYVKTAGRNAAVLVRTGQDALTSSDATTAEAAAELVKQALLLRRHAALALVKIYVAMAWPHPNLAVASFLDGYRRLSGAALLLGRLQKPAAPIRISVW
jgi:hypothetical protein